MQSKPVHSFDNLPGHVLNYLLSFSSPQEKVDTLLVLRTVCKKLQAVIDSDDFLKQCAGVLHLKKQLNEQKNLKEFLSTEKVINNQIEDWSNVKIQVDQVFAEFYTNLPQIKPVIALLDDIRNTPLPASSYFATFRNIFQSRLIRYGLVCLILTIAVAIIYSVLELPELPAFKAKRDKVEQELLDEGCTFDSGPHGSKYIKDCNDTVKADVWRNLKNEVDRHLVGPVIVDTIGGLGLIAGVLLIVFLYYYQKTNQPKSYDELQFVNLLPTHHEKLTQIRNSFRDLNNNYAQIKDVAKELEEVIDERKLPKVIEEEILALQEQYQTIISMLDAEIEKLQEYKSNNKTRLSMELADGTPKTVFRANIYNFFAKCKVLTSAVQPSCFINNEKDETEFELRTLSLNIDDDEQIPLMLTV